MPTERPSVRERLVEPLPLITGIVLVSLGGLALSRVMTNPYSVVLPAMALLGACLSGLLVYHYRDEPYELAVGRLPAVRVPLVALAVGVAAATVYVFATSGFQRTMPVHLLQFGLYGVVGAAVFLLSSTRIALALVVGAGLVHRATIYYASALALGLDTQFHNRAAAGIAETGHLGPLALSKYWYAPLYHLASAAGSAVLGVPIRDAVFLTTSLFATVAPAVGIAALLRYYWNGRLAVLGAYLYLLSDYALSTSVVAGPTSVGLGLFTLLVPVAVRYVDDGSRRNLAAVGVLVGLLVITHQLTLFVTTVAAVAYLTGLALWRGTVTRREITLGGLLVAAITTQWSVTRYSGPAGDAPNFLTVVVDTFVDALGAASVRGASSLPADAGFVVSGAEALTPLHVLGFGLLVCASILGVVFWLTRTDGGIREVGIGLTVMLATMTVFVFVGPMFGIEFLIPRRWFRFLYVPLVILATPGLAAMVATLSDLGTPWLDRRSTVALTVAFLVLLAPYVVVMSWNYPGAVDDPVFDDAPGAQRLSTTAAEDDLYRTVAARAGGSTVVADHVARQMIERHYGRTALMYRTSLGESGTVYDDPQLVVYRAYADTKYASYVVRYADSRTRVFGRVPFDTERGSVVYTNGEDRVFYRP